MTALKGKNPEAIFIPGYYTEVGLIARQARELGLNVPLMGGDGWDSPKTLEIGGVSVNESYFSTHYAADDPDPKVKDFVDKYRKKHGSVPDAMAVLGYDAAALLFDAITRAGTTDPGKIRDALAATQNFSGVSGAISMDPSRNARKRLVILKIDNGNVHFYDAVKP